MNPHSKQNWPDDDEIETVELPPEEMRSIASALVDLSIRLFSRIRSLQDSFKISFSAKEEEDSTHNEGIFELRFLDLATLPPSQEQEVEATLVSDNDIITKTPALAQSWSKMRLFSPYTFLLLLIFAIIAGSAPYQPTAPALSGAQQLTLSIDSKTIVVAHDLSISSFVSVGQGQIGVWPGRSSDNSTIVIPGVAMGHSVTPKGVVDWSAAPMPANCLVSNDVDVVYSTGHISLWLVGASYPYALVHLHRMTSTSLNSWKGWQLLIGVLMKRGFAGPVTLTIGNQSNGPVPSFHGILDDPPLTSLTVDLHNVPAYVAQAAVRSRILWTIPLYLPGAGCYTIRTQWPGGTHLITISAGQ